MPPPSFLLRIPQPCPESWDAMTPAGGGRHCAACAKTVVDFTRQTDAEVLAYFRQVGAGKTCGRFRAGQLGRKSPLLRWRAMPWLAASLAAVLSLTHCSPDPAMAPKMAVQPGFVVITGQVLDRDTRQPLAGAWVVAEQDTQRYTRTAADGSFTLALPQNMLGSKLIAAQPWASDESQRELGQYIPHYFEARAGAVGLLRRVPPIIGEARLEPGETWSLAILRHLTPQAPPLPPPNILQIEFSPPSPPKHTQSN